MTEPEGNGGIVDAGVQQCHRRSVAQSVRGDVLGGEGRAGAGRGEDVLVEQVRDGVAAEASALMRLGNNGSSRRGRERSVDPALEQALLGWTGSSRCRRGVCGLSRCSAGEAPVPSLGVGAGQRGQFGDPESGLHGDEQQQVVAAALRGGLVRDGQQRVGLGAGEEADVGGVAAFPAGWRGRAG